MSELAVKIGQTSFLISFILILWIGFRGKAVSVKYTEKATVTILLLTSLLVFLVSMFIGIWI